MDMDASPLLRFGGKLITRSLPPGSHPLLLALSYHLMELEIHIARIMDNRLEFVSTNASSDADKHRMYYELLTDAHSYVIAWTNVDKALGRLVDNIGDTDLKKIRQKRKSWFGKMRTARNHMEHLDERVTRLTSMQHSPDIARLMSGQAKSVSILGVRVDIGQRMEKRLLTLLEELDLWLDGFEFSN